MVIRNLDAERATAQQVIADAVDRLPFDRTCECATALQHAIITRPERPGTRRELARSSAACA